MPPTPRRTTRPRLRTLEDPTKLRDALALVGTKRFYWTAVWRALRKEVLTANPWCVVCMALGQHTTATEVDHIKAIAAGGEALNPQNLCGLCGVHHKQKTMAVDSGRVIHGAARQSFVVTDRDGWTDPWLSSTRTVAKHTGASTRAVTSGRLTAGGAGARTRKAGTGEEPND